MIDQPVLVAALDASDARASLLEQVQLLGDRLKGSSLWAAHALAPLDPVTRAYWNAWASMEDDLAEIEADRLRVAESLLTRQWKRLGGDKGIALRVGLGAPVETLLELGAQLGPTLLVLDAGGRGRGRLGGVAHALLAEVPWQVLLRRPGMSAGLPKRWIVGVDLSPASAGVLAWALRWADALGATVLPVAVVPSVDAIDHVGWYGQAGASDGPSQKQRKESDRRWTRILDTLQLPFGLQARLEDLLLPLEVRSGDPAAELLAASEAPEDWLVIGRVRDGSRAGAGIGRVAEELARESESPLLLVPPGALTVES